MKPKRERSGLVSFTLVALIMLLTLVPEPALSEETSPLYRITRGGRLYDNWFLELRDQVPDTIHPAYPLENGFVSNEDTWRCNECHGWDYKGKEGSYGEGTHATGIKGIRDMVGGDLNTIIDILKDDGHAYGGLLEEQDFHDLALFVSKGQVDMDYYIHHETGEAKGHKLLRQNYYKSICASCHGLAGNQLRSLPPLSNVAINHPWMSMHKMLNGHPGENMPTLRMVDSQILVDILAYVQSMGQGELTYSIVRGGRLYSDWRKENQRFLVGNWNPRYPANKRHPAYPLKGQFAASPKVNWRCKECHGWDYRGVKGAYGLGEHFTGIKGIDGMRGAESEAIIAILKDENHNYDEVLEFQDFHDIANFVGQGQIEMAQFIDPLSGLFRGVAAKGKDFYETICVNCHGLDGQMIRTTPLSDVVRRDPWHALHDIVNGHPNEAMPALRVLGTGVLSDILTYVQSLDPVIEQD